MTVEQLWEQAWDVQVTDSTREQAWRDASARYSALLDKLGALPDGERLQRELADFAVYSNHAEMALAHDSFRRGLEMGKRMAG